MRRQRVARASRDLQVRRPGRDGTDLSPRIAFLPLTYIMTVLTGAFRVAAASSGARAMLMKRAAVPAAMQGTFEW